MKRRCSTGAEEMNVLANLMGRAVAKAEEDAGPIKMNFDSMWAGGEGGCKDDEGGVETVRIDGVGRRSSLAERMCSLDMDMDVGLGLDRGRGRGQEEGKAEAKSDGEEEGEGEGEEGKGGSDDEEDLLDLLDSVK
jgi:hypothetical protein